MTNLLVPQDDRRALRKIADDGLPEGHRPDTVSPLRRIGRIAGYIALIIAAAALLLPFFWMIMSSLKTANEVFSVPIQWIPEVFVWQNFVDIWNQSGMLTWIRNTLVLAVVVTFLQVLTGSFAAYGFARIRFPGRDVLFLAYIGTIAVPWQSYMIPQFILLSNVKVSNTLWAIILIQAFGAFGVFLMKQFYETIPEELSEAARLDGLSEYGIWWHIMLPLSLPALSTLTIFTFVNTWNDFLGPLIYLTKTELKTIQIGLRMFITQYSAEYGLIMAASVVALIPVLIVFLSLQKYFVQGVASTGIKG